MKVIDLVIGVAVVTGGVKAYEYFSSNSIVPIEEQPQISWSEGKPKKSKYRCDGRQYCSQMRSREEAEYFNYFCADTKMDGDRDGIPCENDSRW